MKLPEFFSRGSSGLARTLPLNFITLHYLWIIFCGLLVLVVIAPEGNVPVVDAYFFGASASTESGLNTIDVKDLRIYQQLCLYFIPIVTNLGVINIFVIVVRLFYFKKQFKETTQSLVRDTPKGVVIPLRSQPEATVPPRPLQEPGGQSQLVSPTARLDRDPSTPHNDRTGLSDDDDHITIKTPHEQIYANTQITIDESSTRPVRTDNTYNSEAVLSSGRSVRDLAESIFTLNTRLHNPRRMSQSSNYPAWNDLPGLTRQVTIGRNSQFFDLTAEDEERLGGIEYSALKLLLKIVTGYYVGLHIIGVVGLVPWIQTAPAKYVDWLAECGQDKTWWAVYSAQTMINNLGFTLTPDSMVTFKDATWPLLLMTFLAFAGNTLYPVFLRLFIWVLYLLHPASSPRKQTLRFLLDHPRRCYTLLFPSRPTWILFGIIASLNLADVIFIVALDLDNPAVNDLPMGPRILSALFQAASARHTGTATFNLADINPAVQFSLLIMMYIAILPIAISVRASNTYEEQSLGLYGKDDTPDESRASNYITTHVRNQLSFDLWYIFLGTFCICIAESGRIKDLSEPAFSVFPVFFEVVSAYGNVGLSLGHPSVLTSLSGQFTIFSKLVICAMMIRGRHRCLPYAIDRAIMLPGASNPKNTVEGSYRDEPISDQSAVSGDLHLRDLQNTGRDAELQQESRPSAQHGEGDEERTIRNGVPVV